MPALQIILDRTTAYPPGSGSERYTRNLVRALVALKSAHMYTLLSNTRPTLSDELSAETVFRRRGLAPGGAFWPMLWQRARLPLPADLFTGHADLWHGLHFSLPPLRRGKRVVTVPDLAFLTHPDMVEPTLAAYLRRVAARAVQRADAILTLSAFTRQALLEQLRVPAEHVHLALPGVSAGFARITDTMLLEATRHKFELQPPVLLTVGTLGPRKNLVRLIEAFDTIHREPSGPKLLAIVGANGWGYQPVYEAVNRRGLQQQVRFLPAVSDLELVLLYSLADLVVLPSLYEGVGLAVLEAMACGAPVLCSNTTALAEAAGDAALLVTPTDTEALAKAMLRLLRNSSLRALLSKKGLAQAAKFRWDACALAHLKVYEGLAAGKEGSMTSQSVAGPANRA